ncbi:MAG: [Fe-Fe] hydrogenase large subunit C-terminal domain-containing protein [Planctomycetia bacterium]|nr:[Fe-Fe] hydrogenase large subunit C-terminal domain-containing protein [Planctomycetia bacterium]
MSITRREVLKNGVILSAATAAGVASNADAQFGWKRPQQQFSGRRVLPFDPENPAILYNRANCQRCGDCVVVCKETQKVFGNGTTPSKLNCIYCGQCVANCWNNGVTERFHLQEIYNAIRDNRAQNGTKKFVAIVSPAVRATLGEMFGFAPGTNVEKLIPSALRRVGFDYVFDAVFGADLTVMEEAAELKARLASGKKGPLFTSCCPAWVRFVELFYEDYVPNISSCKSPLLMHSAIIKTWFAKKMGWKPEDVVVAAITPCTAKKYERTLGERRDLDFALTTREFGWWLMELEIPFAELEPSGFDSLLGEGSGAGALFGNTGGVTEAVLRTLYFENEAKKPPQDWLTLTPVRGLDGFRKAEIQLGDRTLRIGIVHGTGAARDMFRVLKDVPFDFIEVMACRGGCIGGGGLPKTELPISDRLRTDRMGALFARDKSSKVRLSSENPEIQALYRDFLKETGNELLHR